MDYDTIDDVYLAGKNPEYDAAAKKLLSSKKILAWILKYCVEEFKDCSIADIRDRYIIGIPETASVPVLPDETNAAAMVNADRISGERTEDTSVTEGKSPLTFVSGPSRPITIWCSSLSTSKPKGAATHPIRS